MEDQEPMVTLTKQEYDTMQEDLALLKALCQAGVDNWDGYDNALDILEASGGK